MDGISTNLKDKRVLICEDEGLIKMHWTKLLDSHGASIVGFTSSGDECVELAIKNRPDIVIMDLELDGSDGWESSSRILEAMKTCIVVVTAQSRDRASQQLANIPVHGFIQKPVSGDEFLRVLAECYTASD